MPRIVSLSFATAGKLYDFDAKEFDLKAGDSVIVETERGKGIATVQSAVQQRDSETLPPNLSPVLRKATEEDFAIMERIKQKEEEAFVECSKKISERQMDMKLVRVEYQFDESKAVFFFTADGRVDFRDLVKDLAHTFHTRIEMRQIGVRDESKMIGGIGICGRELCCSSFLRDFQPVSVKMAKEQNLALNPNKISGQCGRLLCCLDYEYDTYCSLRKSFPKNGKKVCTSNCCGTVDKVNLLTGEITVRLEDNKFANIKFDEIINEEQKKDEKPVEKREAKQEKEKAAPPKKAEAPPEIKVEELLTEKELAVIKVDTQQQKKNRKFSNRKNRFKKDKDKA